MRSQNHLQIVRRICPLSISSIQQKATVPFFNRTTETQRCATGLWSQRMVAGLGVESKSPDSQSREQNGTTSLIFHVFSPDQSYPPTLSAANEHANSSATTACLGHLGTSKLACSSPYALMYHASTHLPSLVHNHFLKTSL